MAISRVNILCFSITVVGSLLFLSIFIPNIVVQRSVADELQNRTEISYCWLQRDRNSKVGHIFVSSKSNFNVPFWTNIWDNYFNYWKPGTKPIHFGYILIDEEKNGFAIFGWSYKNLDFWRVNVFIPNIKRLVDGCKESKYSIYFDGS